jgi:hypothetical protein
MVFTSVIHQLVRLKVLHPAGLYIYLHGQGKQEKSRLFFYLFFWKNSVYMNFLQVTEAGVPVREHGSHGHIGAGHCNRSPCLFFTGA